MRRLIALIAALLATSLAATTAVAAHTVVVWSGDMDGWAFRTTDSDSPPNTASGTFIVGPGTPPLGTGSAQLAVGTNGAGAAELRQSDYAGTLLADLTVLTYWTYITAPGSDTQAPYIILNIDLNGDSTSDDLLFFEPAYQTGSFSGDPVPNQGAVTTGVWQDWDAHAGGWWSLNAGTFGPPLVTLDTYIAANPTARIINSADGGGLRIVTGFGAGAWDGFIGSVDAVVIGTTAHTTTFDFEVAPVATPTPTPSPTPSLSPTTSPSPSSSVAAAAPPLQPPLVAALPDTAESDRNGVWPALVLAAMALAGVAVVSGRSRAKRR